MRELHAPRLHPLVVAAGQGLVSVMGLVALQAGRAPKPRAASVDIEAFSRSADFFARAPGEFALLSLRGGMPGTRR